MANRDTKGKFISNTEKDFWNKVDVRDDNECWEWKGRKEKGGHGRFDFNGKAYLAHRLAYMFLIGKIPQGKQLNHSCHNEGCCNPKHLVLGTQFENMQDSDVAKLTWKQVRLIRLLYKTGLYSQRRLAKNFNTSQTQIQYIVNKKTWQE